MELFDLPSEIISSFFTTLTSSYGLRQALKARAVCKRFEAEISLAICLTKALEGLDRPRFLKSSVGLRMVIEYLFMRTVADHSQQYPETKAIHSTLCYIHQKQPRGLLPGRDYTWEACVAIAQWEHFYPFGITDRWTTKSSIAENAFALAAYLGMASLVQSFIEEGVADVKTYFGQPLMCIAKHPDSAIASIYLKTKLQIHQGTRRERTSVGSPDNSEAAQTHARGISAADYNMAFRVAVSCGRLETAHLLIKAAFDDGEFGTGPTMGIRYLRPVKHPRNIVQDAILVLAARFGQVDTARAALDHGADPNAEERTFRWYTPALEAAARNGRAQMVELLLKRGANLQQRRPNSPLLSCAAWSGCLATAKVVIDAGGAIIPESCPVHEHPLATAANFRRPKMFEFLLKNGLKLDIGSPLHDYVSDIVVAKGDIENQAILAQYISETQISLDQQSTVAENTK